MKKQIALLLALACLFAPAACSSPPPEDTGTPELTVPETAPGAETPEAETPEAETPGAPETDLSYVTSKGELVIGITEYEPMNFRDESGAWTGFDTEFAETVCAKLGIAPVFQEIDWNSKETELKGRTIDCIWNGLTVDDDRCLNMDFSLSYLRNEQVVVVPASAATYYPKGGFDGVTVVAEEGSAGETAAAELTGAVVIPVQSQSSALLEVKSGTAGAAVIDSTMASAMTGEGTEYSDLATLDLSLTAEEYAIGFRLGSDLTAAVNAIIGELTSDGTLEAIAGKYGLSDRLVK